MKNCATCPKLIKNGYTKCFECNSKQDPVSDNEIPYHKETIPKCVRNALWINFHGKLREGKCGCCKRETISIGNFHCGHIIAEANGGSTTLDNMIPICPLCNTSSGKCNMLDFIKYNLHYGLTEIDFL